MQPGFTQRLITALLLFGTVALLLPQLATAGGQADEERCTSQQGGSKSDHQDNDCSKPKKEAVAASPVPFTVEKTADFDGQPLAQLRTAHLGKMLTYNILVRRSGDINDQTQLRISEDMSGMCGSLLGLRNADGSLNTDNIEITKENQPGGVGTQITVNDACVITILGDAKAIVGNMLHIKVRVRQTLPASAVVLPNTVSVALAATPDLFTSAVLNLSLAPEVTQAAAEAAGIGNIVACADGMSALVVSRGGQEVGRTTPSVAYQWVAVQGLASGPYDVVSGSLSTTVTVVAGADQSAGWGCTPLGVVTGGSSLQVQAGVAGEGAVAAQSPAGVAGVSAVITQQPGTMPAALPNAGGSPLPVPLLALGGVTLLALGWTIRRSRQSGASKA